MRDRPDNTYHSIISSTSKAFPFILYSGIGGKLYFYFIFIFFSILMIITSCDKSISPSESSTGWYIQREQQDDITYTDIFFADLNNGWIVGYEGTIQHTSDGGDTWAPQQSGVSSILWDIDFLDSKKGWICGADNTILKTTDGGNSWVNISHPDTVDKIYIDLEFITDDVGWISSSNKGDILSTNDGGLTWILKKQIASGGGWLSVFDANTIYVFTGRLYRSFDSGESWDNFAVPKPMNYASTRASFPDRDNGWVATMNGTGGEFITEYPVLITNDGGVSWRLSDPLNDMGLTTSYFINADVGWVGGFQNVYKTIDGGIHWTYEFSPKNRHLNAKDMFFIDENLGWLLSYEGNIYKYVSPSL